MEIRGVDARAFGNLADLCVGCRIVRMYWMSSLLVHEMVSADLGCTCYAPRTASYLTQSWRISTPIAAMQPLIAHLLAHFHQTLHT